MPTVVSGDLNNCARQPPQFFTTFAARAGPFFERASLLRSPSPEQPIRYDSAKISSVSRLISLIFGSMAKGTPAISLIVAPARWAGGRFESLRAAWCIRTSSVGKWGAFAANREWSQAQLAREHQKASWDISRSEVSKIEMRIREVKDWQMMLLVRVLDRPHEACYPRLDPAKPLRETFAASMAKKLKPSAAPKPRRANTQMLSTSPRVPGAEEAAVPVSHACGDTALPANTLARLRCGRRDEIRSPPRGRIAPVLCFDLLLP